MGVRVEGLNSLKGGLYQRVLYGVIWGDTGSLDYYAPH